MSIHDTASRFELVPRPDHYDAMTNILLDTDPSQIEAVQRLFDDRSGLTTSRLELEGTEVKASMHWVPWDGVTAYTALRVEDITQHNMSPDRRHPHQPEVGDIVIEARRPAPNTNGMWWVRGNQIAYVSPVEVSQEEAAQLPLHLSHILNRIDLHDSVRRHQDAARLPARAMRAGGTVLRALAWANLSYHLPRE